MLDHLVAAGSPTRPGSAAFGLSYGGFLVNWLIAPRPQRFAAAVSENGVSSNQSRAAGRTPTAAPTYNAPPASATPSPPEGVELQLWRQSPLRHVADIPRRC